MRNRHRLFTRAAAVVGCALLSACGDHGEPEPGLWGAKKAWRLTEQARIGSVDGAGPDAFSNVVDVALDAYGRVWVADGQESEVRVFDGAGKHVRTIGRKGGGPAEFNGIAGMAWGHDENLWIMDPGNARFAVYDTAGKLVATYPRNSTMVVTPWPGILDRRGRLHDITGTLDARGEFRTSIVRFDAKLQPRDTFPLPPFESETFEIKRGNASKETITKVGVPFAGTQMWRLDPDGFVWVANTSQYRIERHGFDSADERVVQRKTRPVRVPSSERERMLEQLAGFVRQGGKIDESRIPDTYPAIVGFLFDDTGRIWVTPETPTRAGRALDVFENDGRYLGRVALPTSQRSSVQAVRGDRMVVVARDSLDVQSVILLRIVKPAG